MKCSIVFSPELWQKFDAADLPRLAEVIEESTNILAAFQPTLDKAKKNGERRLSFVVPADDLNLQHRLKAVEKVVRAVEFHLHAVYSYEPARAELHRARAIEVNIQGEFIDRRSDSTPYNQFQELCSVCHRPDLERLPRPYVVNKDPRRKISQDIFGCSAGTLIVRQHVRDALTRALGDDVEWGPAACVEDTGREEQLWFMRPRVLMPPQTCQQVLKRCHACEATTEVRVKSSFYYNKKLTAQLSGIKTRLTGYPLKPAHIYRAEWFYGVCSGNARQHHYPIYVSGPLWKSLRDLKVRGIRNSTMCFAPEPSNPLLADASPLEVGKAQPLASSKRPMQSAKDVALISKLPWDQKEGFLHFAVTTGNLAMFDPMLNGEDGTYFEIPPGVYRLPVASIRGTESSGASVDSACLAFVDAAFLEDFVDAFNFDRYSPGKRGENYLEKVAAKIGCRFALCPALNEDSGCDFLGDGCYTLDLTRLERLK